MIDRVLRSTQSSQTTATATSGQTELPAAHSVRVVLADDHAGYLAALAQSLERNGIWVVEVAASGRGAVDAAMKLEPDVALVDLRMRGLSGIEVARELRRRRSPARVAILSAHAEDALIALAICAGAVAYVSKDIDPEGLARVVRRCAAGELVLPPSLHPDWARLATSADEGLRRVG